MKTAPFRLEGAAVIVDEGMMDGLLYRLHHGDPTLGWEGDPTLVVSFHRPSQRWELWGVANDGGHYKIATSKPGHSFPPNLIQELVRRDVRRGYSPGRDVDSRNEAVKKEQEYQESQKRGDVIDRIYHAVRRAG